MTNYETKTLWGNAIKRSLTGEKRREDKLTPEQSFGGMPSPKSLKQIYYISHKEQLEKFTGLPDGTFVYVKDVNQMFVYYKNTWEQIKGEI